MDKNYYEILCVDVDANESEIKSAYRALVRKYHPDIAGNSEENIKKFKEIQEAYEILSDAEKRKKYDTIRGVLHKVHESKKNTSKNSTEETKKNNEETKEESDKKDSFEKTVFEEKKENFRQKTENQKKKNKFQDAWESFINKNNENKKSTQTKFNEKKIDGSDIVSDITISIEESINGTTRTVNVLHTEPCPKCKGRHFANGSVCSSCNGSGETSIHKKISVKIPKHVKQGSKIRIAGEGNQGLNGGKNGDLYLYVKVNTESSPYKYDGLNILQTVAIEPYEAVLGGTVSVKTPRGNVSMKLMSGTSNGQKYRLAKQGLEENGRIGDMIITISIEIPKNLSKEEVLLYEQLRQVAKKNTREKVND